MNRIFARSRLVLAVLLGCLVVSPAVLGQVAGRITRPLSLEGRVTLDGNVSAKVAESSDLGRVGADFALNRMSLMLRSTAEQQAALAQLLADQQDPHSAKYHQWLSPEQYAAMFGLADSDLAAITTWLQEQGLQDVQVGRTRSFVSFTGSAASVERAFGAEIHRVTYEGRAHYANTSAPTIPVSLMGVVGSISGLDDFSSKPMIRREASPAVVRPAQAAVTNSNFTPALLSGVYDLGPLSTANVTGAGITIVVVGQAKASVSDLNAFQQHFGLPQTTPTVVLYGTDPGAGTTDDIEESDLDLEWVSAVAPGATVVYEYAVNAVDQALVDAIDNKRGQIISVSFANCEASSAISASIATVRQAIQAGNSMGITVLAASGDTGAAACEPRTSTVATTGLAVNFPASAPETTAVGGTEFAYSFGSGSGYVGETTWNDTVPNTPLSATGGGQSALFAQPSWQNVPGVPAGTNNRYVPDVALNASTSVDPYTIVMQGSTILVGGTSAATPSWAGILALVEQYLVQNGIARSPGLGNANPMLYKLSQVTNFPQTGTTIFHDVTTGTNKVPCKAGSADCGSSFTVGFSAGVGFDETTGLGSVDANQLALWWGYLTGTPVLGTSPGSVSFVSQVAGTSSDPQAVVISNTGNGLLSISSIGLTGANAGMFTETDTCGTPKQVFPGDSCTVYVTFAPTAAGNQTASLSIASNAAGSPASVAVTGTAVAATAAVVFTPATIYFPNTVLTLSATTQTVQVTSVGSLPLTVSSVAISGANAGDFTVTNNCTTQKTVGSCTIAISFTPTGAGLRTATVTVTGNTAQSQSFGVSGSGVQQLTISQGSLTFNNHGLQQTSAASQVTLSNLGSSAITLAPVNLAGANPGDFRMSNDCGTTIAAGAQCGVTVWFIPTALGARSARISTNWSGTVAGQTLAFVDLSGTGVAAVTAGQPQISMSPGFATVIAGGGLTSADNVAATSVLLTSPLYAITDSAGNVYFADYYNSAGGGMRIRKITAATGILTTIAGSSTAANFSGDGGPAANAGINVTNMQFDPSGNIVIANEDARSVSYSTLRRINLQTGIITTIAGTVQIQPPLTSSALNDGIPATSAWLNASSFVFDAKGNIFVSDGQTCRVRRIDAATGVISTIAGAKMVAYGSCPGVPPAVGVSATTVNFGGLGDLALDPAGHLRIDASGVHSVAVDTATGLITQLNLPLVGLSTTFDAAGDQRDGGTILFNSDTPAQTAQPWAGFKLDGGSASVPYFSGSNGSVDAAGDIASAGGLEVVLLSPNAMTMNFGGSVLGVATQPSTLTIGDTGGAELSISSIALQGTNAGDFTATPKGCTTVAAGTNGCTVAVTFNPLGVGNRVATLVVTDNAPGSPHTVLLNGAGQLVATPKLTASVSSLFFYNVALYTESQAQTVQITNPGTAAATIAIDLGGSAGDFHESDTCGNSLAAGATCTITIIFEPTAIGTRTSQISVTSQVPGVNISLGGTAIAAAQFMAAPSVLAFSVPKTGAASAAQSVVVSNPGSSALTLSSVTLKGTNAADFLVENSTCGSALAAGDGCTIEIGFNPGQPGGKTATLTFSDSAAGSPHAVSLTGAVGTTTVSLSASTLSGGTSLVGTAGTAQSITVMNTGQVPLVFGGLALSGPNASDFTETNTCTPSVATGASCKIQVVFTPSGAGVRAATLTLTNNAADSPESITLSGTGTVPATTVTVSPASLTFTSQNPGSTSAAQTVTLANTGGAALLISSIATSGDFSTTNTCGASLAAGANCVISVTFTPTAAGARIGTLTVTDSATGSPQTVALNGTGGGFSVSSSSTSLMIASPGGSATATIQLSATNGYTGTVALTCAVSYQGQGTSTSPPTCSLSPAQVLVTSTTLPGTSTLTVSSTAASASFLPSMRRGRVIALAGLLVFALVPWRRRYARLLMLVVLSLVLGGSFGCSSGSSGGSSNTAPTTPTGNSGTTVGAYQVVVTAVSGSVTTTATIPLTLQ